MLVGFLNGEGENPFDYFEELEWRLKYVSIEIIPQWNFGRVVIE